MGVDKKPLAIPIIDIGIAIIIAVFPFVLEAMGMKMPVWVWFVVEILAFLMVIYGLVWLYLEKIKVVYLKSRDFLTRINLMQASGKIVHHGYGDVQTRFNLKIKTPDDVQKEMQTKIDNLQNQINTIKRRKGRE
jgi:hypothetical protein